MKILLVDNFDSFTFNLVHYLESFNATVEVQRNNEIDFNSVQQFDKYVISPGPGLPKESGSLMKFLKVVDDQKPILGVCLGFQAIIEFYGGSIFNQIQVKHGVSEICNVTSRGKLFKDIPNQFEVGLYHSWAADQKNFPQELTITSQSNNGVIMSFEHNAKPQFGVQFHPESILTQHGKKIIENFLNL